MTEQSVQSFKENLMNRKMQPYKNVNLKKFRETVNAISDDEARRAIESYYLTASRMAELSSVCYPSRLLTGQSRSYGCFMSTAIQEIIVNPAQKYDLDAPLKTHALILTLSVAKRGKHYNNKKAKKGKYAELEEEETSPAEEDAVTQKQKEIAEELATIEQTSSPQPIEVRGYSNQQIESTLLAYNQRDLLNQWLKGKVKITPDLIDVITTTMHSREVALPFEFDPWVRDIFEHGLKSLPQEQVAAKKIDLKKMDMSWHISPEELRLLIRRELKAIMPPVQVNGKNSLKNILRHWRLTHLENLYGFTDKMTTAFTGWSVLTSQARSGAGMGGVSANVEKYVERPYMTYYPQLCTPLDDILKLQG